MIGALFPDFSGRQSGPARAVSRSVDQGRGSVDYIAILVSWAFRILEARSVWGPVKVRAGIVGHGLGNGMPIALSYGLT